jgi:hypothetical protein
MATHKWDLTSHQKPKKTEPQQKLSGFTKTRQIRWGSDWKVLHSCSPPMALILKRLPSAARALMP